MTYILFLTVVTNGFLNSNDSKTKLVSICLMREPILFQWAILVEANTMAGTNLQQCSLMCLLGITFIADMKWKEYTQ